MKTRTGFTSLVALVMVMALALIQAPAVLAAAPSNDNFSAALGISQLPFINSVNDAEATREAGEPLTCGYWVNRTVWYKYTPTTDAFLNVTIAGNSSFTPLAVSYANVPQGTTPGFSALVSVGCITSGGSVTFQAQAGTTYYIQATDLYFPYGDFTVTLEEAVLQADFSLDIHDPSVFDTIQFENLSYDPANMPFSSVTWDFGDGVTGEGDYPIHQYEKDGDYSVQLTATTTDNRTAQATQMVNVRTHDVAITKFTVSQSAGVGQTRIITVNLNNRRYSESVEMQLFKSVPGGVEYELVGTIVQSVPVHMANRTTPFTFNYTFTGADAKMGKVTFKALAIIQGERDALPADNLAISAPVKINR